MYWSLIGTPKWRIQGDVKFDLRPKAINSIKKFTKSSEMLPVSNRIDPSETSNHCIKFDLASKTTYWRQWRVRAGPSWSSLNCPLLLIWSTMLALSALSGLTLASLELVPVITVWSQADCWGWQLITITERPSLWRAPRIGIGSSAFFPLYTQPLSKVIEVKCDVFPSIRGWDRAVHSPHAQTCFLHLHYTEHYWHLHLDESLTSWN